MGTFCPYDAVDSGLRVAVRFRVAVRGHFAHTIETDPPIRLAPRPAANPPKMLLGSRNPLEVGAPLKSRRPKSQTFGFLEL